MDTDKNIMNLFRQFKLGNSLFKDEYKISKFEELTANISKNQFHEMAKMKSIQRLSTFILANCPTAIEKVQDSNFITFRTEILVLKMQDFKSIVEAAIQLLSQQEIDKIKFGKTVL